MLQPSPSLFQPVGHFGNIYTWDDFLQGLTTSPIGTYEIINSAQVPVPLGLPLLGAGLGGLIVLRKRCSLR